MQQISESFYKLHVPSYNFITDIIVCVHVYYYQGVIGEQEEHFH